MSRRTVWDEPRESVFRCAECGEKVRDCSEISSDSRCARCGEDLHSCRNCASFDTGAENECREPVRERLARKRANNSCELFRPVLAVDLSGRSAEVSRDQDARKAWDDLFKD